MDRERNLRLRSFFLEEEGARGGKNDEYDDDDDRLGRWRQPARSSPGDAIDNVNDEQCENATPMFGVKVAACRALHEEPKMTGREKRGRMFVERPSDSLPPSCWGAMASKTSTTSTRGRGGDDACTSVSALRHKIHEFFQRLRKSTYVLSASLPTVDEEDGNVLTHAEDSDDDDYDGRDGGGTWKLESNNNVRRAFVRASSFRRRRHHGWGRRRVVHVDDDYHEASHTCRPPPTLLYLVGMPDPHASMTITMLSFYSFPPTGGTQSGTHHGGTKASLETLPCTRARVRCDRGDKRPDGGADECPVSLTR